MTEAIDFLHSKGFDGKLDPWAWDLFVDGDFKKDIEKFRIRDEFIARYGFAILDDQTIKGILPHGPLIEVGAGCGYWTYELQKASIDIIGTEINPNQKWGRIPRAWKSWVPLEKIDGVTAVTKYSSRNLLVCWPSYNESWARDTLKKFTASTVLYVGEGKGGCTADDEFHDLLEAEFELLEAIRIPQFFGLHDDLTIWKRNNLPRRSIKLENL